MNNIKSVQLGLLFVITGALSCTKAFNTIVELDVPHTPIITMNSANTFISDSTALVLRASKGINDSGFCPVITNASVSFYEDGNLLPAFTYNPDFEMYTSPFAGYVGNKSYKIVAKVNGFKDATAEDIMPKSPDNYSLKIKRNARKMNLTSQMATWYHEITITFNDDASRKNYYSFSLSTYPRVIEEWLTNDVQIYGDAIYSLDTDLDAENNDDPLSSNANIYYQKLYMKDEFMNGTKKELVLYIDSGSSEPDITTDPVYILFEHLSENCYKYEKTNQLFQANDGNPFAEPVQIHNNVTNGVGSFRLKNRRVDSLFN